MRGILELPSKDSIVSHINAMRDTEGWKILLVYWNHERERILEEGKKGRSEDKKTQMWSRLSGFDDAVLMAEKLARTRNQITEAVEDIDDA